MRAQPLEARQAIANGTGQRRLARDLCELGVKPNFKIVDERRSQLLPDGFAFIGRLATNGSFYSVQRRDAFQRFFGNTLALAAWMSKNFRLIWARQATSLMPPRRYSSSKPA